MQPAFLYHRSGLREQCSFPFLHIRITCHLFPCSPFFSGRFRLFLCGPCFSGLFRLFLCGPCFSGLSRLFPCGLFFPGFSCQYPCSILFPGFSRQYSCSTFFSGFSRLFLCSLCVLWRSRLFTLHFHLALRHFCRLLQAPVPQRFRLPSGRLALLPGIHLLAAVHIHVCCLRTGFKRLHILPLNSGRCSSPRCLQEHTGYKKPDA